MHRILKTTEKEKKKINKEQPNWNIHALYSDRQLVKKKKLTKYFLPFDSFTPTSHSDYIIHFASPNADIVTYELKDAATLIGRDSFCDIKVDQKNISGQHCVIQFRKVRIDVNKSKPEIVPYIFDIGSKNGTYLDGNKIPSKQYVQLFDGDEISFDLSGKSGIMTVHKRSTDESSESDSEP